MKFENLLNVDRRGGKGRFIPFAVAVHQRGNKIAKI